MKIPRVMIAGTSSGSGKTTAVCVLLSLFKRRGLDLGACKCGPDYIDPMFHRSVLNIPCSNLDPFFCGGNMLRYLLSENGSAELTVIEGVMGYYDGVGENGTDNSSYTVAEKTETPVILTVDAKGASASLLAVIEGFAGFAENSRIKGVLFNRTSAAQYSRLAGLMNKRFGDRIIPVGHIPELPEECRLPSRHLGLVTAGEIDDLADRLNKTADICKAAIDTKAILKIANAAGELSFTPPEIPAFDKITLAVALDDAFCFYYHDTLRLFEMMGADIEYFSPLADEAIPENADGLLLGGGYPELHARELEANINAKNSVAKALRNGMPAIAECGGFQYLGAELDGRKMCGLLPHTSRDTGRLNRFGYITLRAKKDGVFGAAGTALKAHEFHYWDSSDNGGGFRAVKPDGRAWDCGVLTDTLYAGYPHICLCSNLSAAEAFYKKCLRYKENNQC